MQKRVLSLVGFHTAAEIQEVLGEFPDMQVELSYKMGKHFLDEVEPMVSGRVASVHACCPQEPIFPNFGSHDQDVLQASYKAIEESFRTAFRFQADIVVLHPGYVTDLAIPSDNQKRKELLSDSSFLPYVFKEEGSICSPSYLQTDVYRSHAKQAKGELQNVASMGKPYGVRLAVENLNPRVGYLFQTPAEMVALMEGNPDLYICLDVGHLWISSCLYGFDYFSGLKTILDTNRVVNCHLHSNRSNRLTQEYSDDHHSLDRHGFPYEKVVATLLGRSANLVLETVENPRQNILLLNTIIEKYR